MTARRFQIDRETFFVAVIRWEKPRARGDEFARVVAIERLDLDYLRAHVGEHQAAGRPHDDMAKLDDADSRKRQRIAHLLSRICANSSSRASLGLNVGSARTIFSVHA